MRNAGWGGAQLECSTVGNWAAPAETVELLNLCGEREGYWLVSLPFPVVRIEGPCQDFGYGTQENGSR
jgi:hypothetical protein